MANTVRGKIDGPLTVKGDLTADGDVVVSGGLTVDGVTIDAETTAVTGLTASAAELNILDGATVTTAELNKLDGAGAVVASGTQVAHLADLANDADGTAIAAKVNALIDALEAFGIAAGA